MDESDKLSELSLQIQLSATAVATSFVLILIPNVETLTLMAFLMGFLFSSRFAVITTVTMTITWEVVISMVLGFSGVTFPFKLIAWVLISLLGRFARNMRIKYFYEFLLFGALSSLIYDTLVTISLAFFFFGNNDFFLTVLFTSMVFGIFFTVSHTISNAIFFSFIPVILRTIMPLLHDSFKDLVRVSEDYFSYITNFQDEMGNTQYFAILKHSKQRVIGYTISILLIIVLLGSGIYLFYTTDTGPSTHADIGIEVIIDYAGVRPTETYDLDSPGNKSILEILQNIAIVNYTLDWGPPYILAINDVWESLPDDYWIFTINDVGINLDVNSTYLDDGDILECNYY